MLKCKYDDRLLLEFENKRRYKHWKMNVRFKKRENVHQRGIVYRTLTRSC
jgi:hypothetical protein